MIEMAMYALVFAVIGMMVYVLDEWRGVEWYGKVWNVFHKNPLPDKSARGFICGRTMRERVLPAVILVVMACLLLRILGEHDFVVLVLKGVFLMFPGILAGFMLMGFIRGNKAIGEQADKVFHAMDEFEAGKVDVGGMAKDAAETVLDSAGKMGEKVVSFVRGDTPPSPSSEGAPKPDIDTSTKQSKPESGNRRTGRKGFNNALNEFKKRK